MIMKILNILFLALKLVAILINAAVASIVYCLVFAVTTSILAPARGGWGRGLIFVENCVDRHLASKANKKE